MDEQRKREHLDICLQRDVRSRVGTGLERIGLVHQALPEMALDEVSTECEFLGHRLRAPLLISSMTGGTEEAHAVNVHLAEAAQALGFAMGLGSQRVAIEQPSLMATFQVRACAPDVPVYANLGAVQLNYGYGPNECLRAVESVEADALILHLNPLQEALQPGGNTDFGHLCDRIADVCSALPCPVIVKEVGWGLSARVAERLVAAGVAALDVGGAGGTSWSQVERRRAGAVSGDALAEPFADWGIPTAESIVQVRGACPEIPIVASGGIRTGVDVAISLALGAQLAGIALPLLEPAVKSTEAVVASLDVVLRQLRIAMFCCGAGSIADLDASRLMRYSC